MSDSLSMVLLSRMAIIAVIAYVFSQSRFFRLIFKEKQTWQDKCILVVFFASISVAGTYFGIPVDGALANVRDIGSVVGGLLGGPVVGITVGLVSGIHRITLGGFTAVACGVSTVFGGFLSSYIHYKMKSKTEWITGFLTVVSVVLFSMGLILLTSRPYQAAWKLVSEIIIPMSLANGIGVAIFMFIIHNAREYQMRIGALQTNKAMRIANSTLPYLRKGLTPESAAQVAATILEMTSAGAVAITDREKVLAHVGAGSDHHRAGIPLMTKATKKCLCSGRVEIAQNAQEIGCSHADCSLRSAVVVPLFCRDEIVGALKLYHTREEAMTPLDIEFAQGLGQIFSTQLELALLQQKAELGVKAELKALRAQINPHFLFNALNTVVSLCRTDPDEARRLLIHLSDFFRRNLKSTGDFTTLSNELEHVESYLMLEKARFGNRLTVKKDVEPGVLSVYMPTLTLQPLVENAVKHGLLTREKGGTVTISAHQRGKYVDIAVHDDGQGIPPEKLSRILTFGVGEGTGIGLSNVNERLKTLYGHHCALHITSVVEHGTTVSFRVPIAHKELVAS